MKPISMPFLGLVLLLSVAFLHSAAALTPAEEADGFVSLFNSQNLDGWEIVGKPESFTAEDGAIRCLGKGGSYLGTVKPYENYILRLQYKIAPKGNSGIYLHAHKTGRNSRIGGEIQLFDSFGQEPTKNSAGALYDVVAPAANAARPAEEWNDLEIACEWPQLRITLNGERVIDVDTSENINLRYRARFGAIGLQDHNCLTWFRDLRVKDLGGGDRECWVSLLTEETRPGWQFQGDAAWSWDGDTLVGRNGSGRAVLDTPFHNFHLWTDVQTNGKVHGAVRFRFDPDTNTGPSAVIYTDKAAEYFTGSLDGLAPASILLVKERDRYPLQIVARDQSCVVLVNGKVVTEFDRLENVPGKIALEINEPSGAVRFSNLRLQPLDDE